MYVKYTQGKGKHMEMFLYMKQMEFCVHKGIFTYERVIYIWLHILEV